MILPWRRVSPELLSDGHQPEVAHQLPGPVEAGEVADLGGQPDRGERVDPAQAAQPGDGLRVWRARDELGDRRLERARGAARACRSRRGSPAASPARRRRGPARAATRGDAESRCSRCPRRRSRGATAACEPLPGAHQIAAQILAGAHEVAQRLLLDGRHPDRVQRVDHQQPQHPLGVALIGLDLVLRRALDLPRRRHHAPDPRRVQRAREPVPGRARPRTPPASGPAAWPGTPPPSPSRPAACASAAHPTRASNVTASTLRACTSRPAQLRTFAMGRRSFRMGLVVDRRGRHPRRVSLTARHTRGSAGLASTPGRPDLHMV